MNTKEKSITFVVMAANEFLLKNQTSGKNTRWESCRTYDKSVNLVPYLLDTQDILILMNPNWLEVRDTFCTVHNNTMILWFPTVPFLFQDTSPLYS